MPSNPADKETWANNAALIWHWAFRDMTSWAWPVQVLLVLLAAIPIAGVVGWARRRLGEMTRGA